MNAEEDHKAYAAAFAAAVQSGETPSLAGRNTFQHLFALNELVKSQPLLVCKHYAASPDIPWGKFGSLDSLRIVILKAPIGPPDPMDEMRVETLTSDFVALRNPNSQKVVFVFTGALHQFGAPLRLTHQWLRRLDVSIVYIFDMNWNYYLGSLRGLGETVDDVAASLRRMMKGLGATSCCCVGHSSGGFGALLYAMRLQAERALAFSPPTVIRESLDRVRRKVPNLDCVLSAEGTVDLREIHARSRVPPSIRLYFSESNLHDRSEASNLADVAGIELIPVDIASHNLIPVFVQRDQFMPNLKWLVSD